MVAIKSETRAPQTYWASDWNPLNHCFRLVPRQPSSDLEKDFLFIWNFLGEKGYRFRDAGYGCNRVVIALDRDMRDADRIFLGERYSVTNDSRGDLASCR